MTGSAFEYRAQVILTGGNYADHAAEARSIIVNDVSAREVTARGQHQVTLSKPADTYW